MIRTLTAFTENIDDPAGAAAEIREQLEKGEGLLKNTVGIIACHYDFLLSGAAKAVCQALPFEVAGTISTVQATTEAQGNLLLTLFVMTSDSLAFKTACTASLMEEPGRKIAEAYAQAAGGEKPALIFAFAPFMLQNSGDEYVRVISEASGGVPCFGTLAVDDTPDFSACYMLFNGEHYQDKMALILLYGDIRPKFYLASLSRNKLLDKPALVTSSEGHILKEVNGRPVVEYFEGMGLAKASETSYAMTSLPLMLDYGDGTPPVSRVFIGLNEARHAICAGAMPKGSTLYIGFFDKEDVFFTSGNIIEQALRETENPQGIIGYSCISRSITLGNDVLGEVNMVLRLVARRTPLLMAYSGGEICPTRINSASSSPESSPPSAINRFHNNTFVLCVF
jgi:hypothetical protein